MRRHAVSAGVGKEAGAQVGALRRKARSPEHAPERLNKLLIRDSQVALYYLAFMPTRGIAATLTMSLALAAGGAARSQNGDEIRSALTGVYATAQAARGEQTYFNICVACHPRGTYSTDAFKTTWSGRPISDLFDTIKEKMPKNDPGSLTPEETAQVLAYILKINDVPAGQEDLPPDAGALKKITFETPGSEAGKAAR